MTAAVAIVLSLLRKFAPYIIALVAVAGLYVYVQHLRHAIDAARVYAAVQTDKATVTTGQSAAVSDASTIADQGAARDQTTTSIHEDNAHALQSTPGALAPINPALDTVGRRGLCRYAAYAADPGCVGLRVGHP